MISADAVQFEADIGRFIEGARDKAKQAASEAIQDIAQAVVEATPVKTGFLRASWYAALNSPAQGQPGAGNVGQLTLTAADIKLGDVYYMNNGAAYAMRVEFGFVGEDSLGRKYNQSPRSFVRSTLDRAPTIAEDAARRVATTA